MSFCVLNNMHCGVLQVFLRHRVQIDGHLENKFIYSHRHEALVLIQSLLVGGDEKSSILDPAGVETCLFLQVSADHIPGVGQELYLNITGAELPQQPWRNTLIRDVPNHPSVYTQRLNRQDARYSERTARVCSLNVQQTNPSLITYFNDFSQ